MIGNTNRRHSMNQIKLGKQIRKYRLLKKMTQYELSIAIDVSRNFISDLERGVKGCSLERLIQIANVLEVSMDSLLQGDLTNREDATKLEICQDIMKLDDSNVALLQNIIENIASGKANKE